MSDVNILLFEALFSGLVIGVILGRLCNKRIKVGTPSASHNRPITKICPDCGSDVFIQHYPSSFQCKNVDCQIAGKIL